MDASPRGRADAARGRRVVLRLPGAHGGDLRLSSPPPQALLRGLLRPRQALAAWYIAVIAIPGLVEGVHARRPDVLVRLLERSGQSRTAAERDIAVDRPTLTAMLNWYRAMPFGGRDPA